ncbi:MAG: asparagine synthase (glutamine-hydrolyzing) [Chitinophagaceae bacterium]
MCGITGAICPGHKDYIYKAINCIKHRGPDDQGIFSDEFLSLGHNRLAILDLSINGHQPMYSSDGRYVLIFNGEIYNHTDIRSTLRNKHHFKSTSDTETILYGFIEFGTSLFGRMNGIFAFSIYDRSSGDLIIVRDQFGVKPLYFYQQNDIFLFASEIKALLKFEGVNKSVDYSALVNYLYFLWSPGQQTPFENVKKLLPGHYIKLNVKRLSDFEIHKYYEIPFNGEYAGQSEAKLVNELEEKLFNAVKRQLLSDVPVGFFLSGGLDSSAIVAMAAKAKPDERLTCYTINAGSELSYDGFENDLFYAEKVARLFNVDLKKVDAKIDIVNDFDQMIWQLDEPQSDAAPLNVLNICRMAREDGYKVLLGGTGGDDLFSGYRRHQSLYFEKWINHIPLPMLSLVSNLLGRTGKAHALARRVNKMVSSKRFKNDERLADLYSWISIESIQSLFSEEIKKKIAGYDPKSILINALKDIPKEHHDLNHLLFWDMKYFLADHNLNYTDKMAMATGVEVRVPFLDIELVEFSCKLPLNLKMKGKTTKYLLKKVMERYLPKEIIYRSKSGFSAPVRQWITHDLDQFVKDRLSKKIIQERGIFDFDNVNNMIKCNKLGKIDASYNIWSLLAVESWMQQFVDA